MSDQHHFDFLVIGSGIAGLCFALRVAEHGTVGIVTKRDAADSATNQAQGGIAAVLDPTDSFEEHVADTLTAGAGLCKESVVRHVVERGVSRGLGGRGPVGDRPRLLRAAERLAGAVVGGAGAIPSSK